MLRLPNVGQALGCQPTTLTPKLYHGLLERRVQALVKSSRTLFNQSNLDWDSLDIILELPSNESVREAVIAGVGATLISKHVVNLSLQSGLAEVCNLKLPPRNYHMIVHKERPPNNVETALIHLMKENT